MREAVRLFAAEHNKNLSRVSCTGSKRFAEKADNASGHRKPTIHQPINLPTPSATEQHAKPPTYLSTSLSAYLPLYLFFFYLFFYCCLLTAMFVVCLSL